MRQLSRAVLALTLLAAGAAPALATPVEWQWNGAASSRLSGASGTATFTLWLDPAAEVNVFNPALSPGTPMSPDEFGLYLGGTESWSLEFEAGALDDTWTGAGVMEVNQHLTGVAIPDLDRFIVFNPSGAGISGPGIPLELYVDFAFPNPGVSALPTGPPATGFGQFEVGLDNINFDLADPTVVPEPSTLVLLGSGCLWAMMRKRAGATRLRAVVLPGRQRG